MNPMEHTCHAVACITNCKPEFLMCGKHWRMVPRKIQKAVWGTYRPGQCDDKQPSARWHRAADAAIDAVAQKEGLSHGHHWHTGFYGADDPGPWPWVLAS